MTLGSVVTPPQPLSYFASHTHDVTHTPEPGGAQESAACGRQEGKPGVEYAILVDRHDSLLIPTPAAPLLTTTTPTYTFTHSNPPLGRPPRSPQSDLPSVIHRVPKPAALLKPRKSKAWPRFKQQCSWDLLRFRQTALSASLAINSSGGCLP